MSNDIIYRYSITLSYKSAKSGLTELRIWLYSEDQYLLNRGRLNSSATDLMYHLEFNSGLRQSLDAFSPEVGVPLHRGEMEISGHRLNKFYGFTEFIRGKKTSKYYSTSNNGETWSRSAPFRTKLPRELSKKALEKAVMRRFKKPGVIKIKRALWENALKEAKRTGDKKLMAKARGKLAWAGKTQQQISEQMGELRHKKESRKIIKVFIKKYREEKNWSNWSAQMNNLRWKKYIIPTYHIGKEV